jgi:hypothetical protein
VQAEQRLRLREAGGEEGNEAALKSAGTSGLETLKQAGGQALGKLTGSEGSAQVALAALGRVQNPMLELIYTSPNFRTFQFDFLFYPRDEREALEVQRILERFRFHQAPERLEGGFLVLQPNLILSFITVVQKIITFHKLQHAFLQRLI